MKYKINSDNFDSIKVMEPLSGAMGKVLFPLLMGIWRCCPRVIKRDLNTLFTTGKVSQTSFKTHKITHKNKEVESRVEKGGILYLHNGSLLTGSICLFYATQEMLPESYDVDAWKKPLEEATKERFARLCFLGNGMWLR